jgi:hypothetical protein
MSRSLQRAGVSAVVVAVVVGLTLGTASRAVPTPLGNPPPASKPGQPGCGNAVPGPTRETAGDISAGIQACELCHIGSTKGQAAKFLKVYKSDEFVLLNESETWIQADVHSRATQCLTGPLGKQMSAILKYNVAEAPQCLTCHSADKSPNKPLAEKKYKDFATADGGVNCTVCHGLHERWQSDHFKTPDQEGQPLPWRTKTPEEKWSRGMADLRNPVLKATLCVSCHVGSAAEGKVVTHEMYAAGHPPLPPFELASYMEGQPRHWAYPTDPRLKFFASVAAEDRWKQYHFHPEKEESYLSRHFAVGAIAALRAEAEVLLAESESVIRGGDGIDFARFDCYACHHDLKYPSDRQKRGYEGPPGRPTLRASVGIAASIAAKHATGVEAGGLKEKAAGFSEKWAALRKASVARPFGHPAQVRDAAKAIIEWCDSFLNVQCEAAVPLYSPEQAARLRGLIAEAATGSAVADPEATMVLAWAYLTLSREAKVAWPGDRLQALAAVFPLNVRQEPYSIKGEENLPSPARFEPRMKALNAFDSATFRKAFLGLSPGK